MAHYRIYLLNAQGRFARARDCEARTDAEALSAGLAMGNQHGFEVWQGGRMVSAKAEPAPRAGFQGLQAT